MIELDFRVEFRFGIRPETESSQLLTREMVKLIGGRAERVSCHVYRYRYRH
jgi:hypothetical protein